MEIGEWLGSLSGLSRQICVFFALELASSKHHLCCGSLIFCFSCLPILSCHPVSVKVRTQTLVKNAIILVDSAPFKQYYQQHYGVELGLKRKAAAGAVDTEQVEKEEKASHSKHVNRKHEQRLKGHKLDAAVSPILPSPPPLPSPRPRGTPPHLCIS